MSQRRYTVFSVILNIIFLFAFIIDEIKYQFRKIKAKVLS